MGAIVNRSFSGVCSRNAKRLGWLAALLLIASLLTVPSVSAQEGDDGQDEVVIFVLDLSGSMNEPFDSTQTKLDAAKAAFVEAFANVSPDAHVGLRTYGDQIAPTSPELREPSCSTDSRLVQPIAPLQRDQLIAQVQGFSALGDTPMGLALQQASDDIPAGATGTIVLFSDGRDECFDADLDGDPTSGPSFGQDPCEIANDLTATDSGVARVMTVGFSADSEAASELRCIADATGGGYTSIQTPEDARNVLPELLVQLSAPREAQRLIGREIQGTPTSEDAPSLVRLDDVGADAVVYTDTIDMNSQTVYRFDDFGPLGGTFTATVFGLPNEADLVFDIRMRVPELDQTLFRGENADTNAGLPPRPTSSIRCTGCKVTGGVHDVLWVVSLTSPNEAATGTFELEILTEGPGFGGPTTSCRAPQQCFYPQEIVDLTLEVAEIEAQLDTSGGGERAAEELIAQRDRLVAEYTAAEDSTEATTQRAEELEALLLTAPEQPNSFRIPLLMILLGLGLLFAPFEKLRRTRSEDDDEPKTVVPTFDLEPGPDEPASLALAPAPTRDGPTLDVRPAPAPQPTGPGEGNTWDAELEAAKSALAMQLPERIDSKETPSGPPTSEGFTAKQQDAAGVESIVQEGSPERVALPAPRPDFTPEQHAAARAAAEQIQAEKAAIQPSTSEAKTQATVSPAETAAAEQATRERAAAEQAARKQAAAEQAAAEQAAAEQAAAQQAAAEQAAAEQAARKQAAAEQAARERAAAEKAASEKAAAEKAAAQQAAAELAARERAAAEQAASEKAAAEQAAAEQAARDQAARDQAAAPQPAVSPAAPANQPATQVTESDGASSAEALAAEEAQRQEARRRMLAKQNIVASASSSSATSPEPREPAGTNSALRVPSTQPAPGEPAAQVEPHAPGWYEDPAIVGRFRWWDGSTWTGHTSETGQGSPAS